MNISVCYSQTEDTPMLLIYTHLIQIKHLLIYKHILEMPSFYLVLVLFKISSLVRSGFANGGDSHLQFSHVSASTPSIQFCITTAIHNSNIACEILFSEPLPQ